MVAWTRKVVVLGERIEEVFRRGSEQDSVTWQERGGSVRCDTDFSPAQLNGWGGGAGPRNGQPWGQ